MKILIFNWRDIKNPKAGGSEIYFHELAKRWVKSGEKVTIMCGGWKNCKKEEIIDGIKIIRVGSPATLYLLAPFSYFKLKEKPDLIIDVENGIPFFTPLFSRKKRILHIHHIHKDVWFKELSFISAFIGWFIETKIMPFVYRKTKIMTISKSSSEEIKKENFGNVIGIVNPGINFIKYKKFKKDEMPVVLFVNRIKKYKGLDIFLKAVNELNKRNINFEAWIVGDGDQLDSMKNYAEDKQLNNVKFFGHVSEEKKEELMQKAWVFVNPSFKEGWGIVNIEANYFGLPVVGSDVCGIRDSVEDKKTGLLFEYGDPIDMADKIMKLIKNEKLIKQMENNAKRFSKKFSWNDLAKKYLNIIRKIR